MALSIFSLAPNQQFNLGGVRRSSETVSGHGCDGAGRSQARGCLGQAGRVAPPQPQQLPPPGRPNGGLVWRDRVVAAVNEIGEVDEAQPATLDREETA
jgi:hypothetical protein